MNTHTHHQAETKFAAWINEIGVNHLVSETRKYGPDAVTFSAVYQWLRRQYEPRPSKQRMLVKISHGAITFQDIADHFDPPPADREPSESEQLTSMVSDGGRST